MNFSLIFFVFFFMLAKIQKILFQLLKKKFLTKYYFEVLTLTILNEGYGDNFLPLLNIAVPVTLFCFKNKKARSKS